MKGFKRIGMFVLTVAVLGLALTSFSYSREDKNNIYYDNAKIARLTDSYDFGDRLGDTTTSSADISYGDFTGMETIWFIQAKENSTISLSYQSKVMEGNFKAVLIHSDNTVETIVEQGKSGSKTIAVNEGVSRIKIVGKEAAGQFQLNIGSNDDCEIKTIR